MNRFRPLLIPSILLVAQVHAQTDLTHPWDSTKPLPPIITHALVDPAKLTSISKFRSCVGHAFVDNYEYNINQSLKHYFVPAMPYLGTNNLLPIYAPASGIITDLVTGGHQLSNGDYRGYQINLVPDAYPMFGLVLFHVNPAPGLAVGSHVVAGQPLGFADTREAVNFDLAVQALWNAKPLVQNLDPGHALVAPDYKYLSAFDVMSDAVFAQFAPYGLTDRSQMTVTLAYRIAHSLTNQGNTIYGYDINEYFVYPPWFVEQPQSIVVVPGVSASFVAFAQCDSGPFSYQWSRNGVPIPGATDTIYFVPADQIAAGGFFTSTATTLAGSTTSLAASLTLSNGGDSRLVNVSTRGLVLPGGNLTAGFVARGADHKSLLIRGVGPALAAYGVAGCLANPELEIIPAGASMPVLTSGRWIASDDVTSATTTTGAFPLPAGSNDAATLATLPLMIGYTVQLRGSAPTESGVALVEVYDDDPASSSGRLVNVSTLGHSGSGAATLTVGFVIAGTAPKHVLIRAVGPSLASFGVPSPIADPHLVVVPQGIPVIVADQSGWGAGGQANALQAAFDATGAFQLPVGSDDAAAILTLPPGGYTAQATSASGAVGNVLVEVYDLDP